ncbi:MAG: hypothetical protein JSS65_11660 [Armatimonadetes bacterium]|nr:hypothetical protein [Armatimonadota bacterium]
MTSAILLTILLVPRPAESVTLAWAPQKGDQSVWSVDIRAKAGDKDIQAQSSVVQIVTKCNKGTVVIKSTVQDALARTGADEGRLKRNEATTYTLDARGLTVAIEGPQKEVAWRLAPFNRFVWPSGPVAVGDKWAVDTNGDSVVGRAEYKLDSIDAGVAKVSFVAASLAGDKTTKGQGQWVIDTKAGRAVALHAEILGLVAGTATYEMKLVK